MNVMKYKNITKINKKKNVHFPNINLINYFIRSLLIH